jgi:hypothetical protein
MATPRSLYRRSRKENISNKELEYKATLVKGSPYIIRFSFAYYIAIVNH